VLQRTAAADAEARAARHDALRRRLQHLGHHALVVAPLRSGVAKQHALAGQRAAEKDRLAVDVGQAATVVGQGFDLRLDRSRGSCLALLAHG
jgi:hypothetical protein